MNIPLGTVKTKIRRNLIKLRETFDQDQHKEDHRSHQLGLPENDIARRWRRGIQVMKAVAYHHRDRVACQRV